MNLIVCYWSELIPHDIRGSLANKVHLVPKKFGCNRAGGGVIGAENH